jgi:hypothetical protein
VRCQLTTNPKSHVTKQTTSKLINVSNNRVSKAETTINVVSTTKQACQDSRENKNKQHKNENKRREYRRFGLQKNNLCGRQVNKDENARNDQNNDRQEKQNDNRRRLN